MQEMGLQGDNKREILVDRGPSGRDFDWRGRKMRNELLALAYDQVDTAKAARLRSCATVLIYCQDGERKRLKSANFCRVRLCPICQWRRALKNCVQMTHILRYCQQERPGLSYIFLTLTMKNCQLSELGQALDLIAESWHRLMHYSALAGSHGEISVIKGWYRGVEITHNLDYESPNFDTYHPHIHAILAVDNSYFKSKKYISQEKFTALWKKAARLHYDPIVDVRKIRPKRDGDQSEVAIRDAVAEASKYSIKDTDVVTPDDWQLTLETVAGLNQVLAKRRFIGLGGCFMEAHRKLHLDDVDDGDLVKIGDEAGEESPVAQQLVYVWQTGYKQYFRAE